MVDVGANTGFFALIGASLVGPEGSVVAVEACADTMKRLRTNMELNPTLAKRVRPVECAAADGSGIATLYCHRREQLYNTTVVGAGEGGVVAAPDVWAVLRRSTALGHETRAAASKLADDSVWQPVSVKQASLDELLTQRERARVRVVKIDVEGAEWRVLQGMYGMLSRGRTDLEVVVELTPKWLKLQGVTPERVIEYMTSFGFYAYALLEDYEVEHYIPAPPVRAPTRIHAWDSQIGSRQADVIFSRRDVAML
eukprot:CAMPEP_0119332284 /NCGR_PEP_ID=MMETSP1333-20130426/82408_1 /TAXON_ID=418940 /ORGANISM="Scyphosphaera apsteinii, Strain RCC1455" /LENGTH=253 /DNA_ID=CAMNT_0007342077 /DNA_START=443 /DNA_END=1204 /DNA_ORIENTATION=-